jgi:hypothetical protein
MHVGPYTVVSNLAREMKAACVICLLHIYLILGKEFILHSAEYCSEFLHDRIIHSACMQGG